MTPIAESCGQSKLMDTPVYLEQLVPVMNIDEGLVNEAEDDGARTAS